MLSMRHRQEKNERIAGPHRPGDLSTGGGTRPAAAGPGCELAGSERGYCVVMGQKVRIERPRVPHVGPLGSARGHSITVVSKQLFRQLTPDSFLDPNPIRRMCLPFTADCVGLENEIPGLYWV